MTTATDGAEAPNLLSATSNPRQHNRSAPQLVISRPKDTQYDDDRPERYVTPQDTGSNPINIPHHRTGPHVRRQNKTSSRTNSHHDLSERYATPQSPISSPTNVHYDRPERYVTPPDLESIPTDASFDRFDGYVTPQDRPSTPTDAHLHQSERYVTPHGQISGLASTGVAIDRKTETHSDIASNGLVNEVRDNARDEKTPLIPRTKPKVYAVRWYVLWVFCMATLMQGLGWGTFGPITQSCKAVFGWHDFHLAIMGMGACFFYALCSIPFSWLMERKGLRISMIMSMVLMAMGFGLRCISMNSPVATWTMTAGQILIGGAAVPPCSGMPMLSSLWFPLSQRATATSVATVMGFFGISVAFILEAAVAGLVLLLVVVYFPNKPPTPPTYSADQQRLDIRKGLNSLIKNRSFLFVLVAYSSVTGIYGAFGPFLDIDVNNIGVSQKSAGWIGFYSNIGGCAAGFVFSWLSDVFIRRIKCILLLLLVPTAVTFTIFCLYVGSYIPYNEVGLYIFAISPGVLIFGAWPLFYELACEVAYPTGEGITSVTLVMFNNIIGGIFLAILLIPDLGVVWMNYVLSASVALGIIILLCIRVQYHRTNLDVQEILVPSPDEDNNDDNEDSSTRPGHVQSHSVISPS